jgi:hypothetical protein
MSLLQDRRSGRPGPSSVRPAITLVPSRSLVRLGPYAMCVFSLVLSRPFGAPVPQAGLDPGWMLGLSWARGGHLRFGRDVVFTYGPWGWLSAPVAVDVGAVVAGGLFACAAVICLWAAVAGAFDERQARGIDVIVATAVAPVAFVLTGASWTLLLALFVIVLARLSEGGRLPRALMLGVSGAAALLLQVKFSEGLAVVGLACLMLVASASWSRVLMAATAFTMTFILLWLGAGGSLGDALPWLQGSLSEVAGYGDAMYLSTSPASGTGVAAVLLGAACVGLVAIESRETRGMWLWPAVAVLGLLAFAFREGFTREDAPHVAAYVTALLVVGAGRVRGRRRLMGWGVLVLACLIMASYAGQPGDRLPRATWSHSARFVASGEVRAQQLALARGGMELRYGVSRHVLTALGDRPVTVEPFEIGAAWAYRLNWKPVPVLQTYSAYTGDLDAVNARALLVTPHLAVLREEASIDDDYQLWETPRYNLTMACFFRERDRDSRWTLLVRSADRCGPERTGPRLDVRAGRSIAVPRGRPGDLVTVSFTPTSPTAWQRLTSLALKDAHPVMARTGDGWRRLPRGLASGPLLVRLPDSAAWPSEPEDALPTATIAFNTSGTLTFSERHVD